MKIIKTYFITFIGVAAVLAVVFVLSKYYAEEMAVPVISYAEAEVSADDVRYLSPGAIDLNSATAEELQSLDGIGKTTAERIISYREKYGSFDSVDELCEVEGIGKAKLAAIKDMLYVSDEPEVRAALAYSTDEAEQEEKEKATETEKAETTVYIPQFPLDLNEATAEELMCIDGIGEVTAGKIAEFAKTHGFSSVDELTEINGIGAKKLEAIRPFVTVKSPVTAITETTESGALPEKSAETSPEKSAALININTASVDELMQLDGVGKVIAERIREYAGNNGFSSVDELLNVNGIGEKKLEAIRPYVTV